MNSIKLRSIMILFGLVMVTCFSESKSQKPTNTICLTADSIWRECKISKIKKIDHVYIIDVENQDSKFKIVSAQSNDHIKFRQVFSIKHNRDTIEVGETYRFKLVRLYPPTDNFVYGVQVNAIIFDNCIIDIEQGNSYYYTDCLEGLEIIPEMCK